MTLPRLELPRGVEREIAALVRSEDGAAPSLPTRVTVCDSGEMLVVSFDCVDFEPWATLRERDAPLWEEEVVELFLSPGSETPIRYFEFEVNPLGTLFDAKVESPHGDRRDLEIDSAWNCPRVVAEVAIAADGWSWSARLRIPWRELTVEPIPRTWRANFFRIDRPRGGPAEYSCWSPTWIRPADFHRPAQFGFLVRVE